MESYATGTLNMNYNDSQKEKRKKIYNYYK